jgi:hypothetical protein
MVMAHDPCGACGGPFIDGEWEVRHTAHDDRCVKYLDQHAPEDAICSCWPADVHEGCCEVCTPGGVVGAERAALPHLATRRLERAVEILDQLPLNHVDPATIAVIRDLLVGGGP